MIVYIAGPYRPKGITHETLDQLTQSQEDEIRKNIRVAEKVAVELWSLGFVALCPHLNTAGFEKYTEIQPQAYIDGDLELVAVCHAVVMLPEWEESSGARQERDHADSLGIPVYIYPSLPLRGGSEDKVKGTKLDAGKPRTDLIPVRPLLALAELYRRGAAKYADRNWEKGMKYSRLYSALLRHIFAFWNRESYDPEGQHHLDSVAFCTFALREYQFEKTGQDDRPYMDKVRLPNSEQILDLELKGAYK